MKNFIYIQAVILLLSLVSRADMFKTTLFTVNTIYLDRDYDTNGTRTQSKSTDTDFRLIKIERNWAYGGVYSLSANDASSSNRTSMGVTIGYYSERDFFMNYTYFLSSKYNSGGVEYTKGNGYEFDLGFLSRVTSSFYVGLMAAVKNFTYTEQTSGGAPSATNVTHREVVPMFTFGIVFM